MLQTRVKLTTSTCLIKSNHNRIKLHTLDSFSALRSTLRTCAAPLALLCADTKPRCTARYTTLTRIFQASGRYPTDGTSADCGFLDSLRLCIGALLQTVLSPSTTPTIQDLITILRCSQGSSAGFPHGMVTGQAQVQGLGHTAQERKGIFVCVFRGWCLLPPRCSERHCTSLPINERV